MVSLLEEALQEKKSSVMEYDYLPDAEASEAVSNTLLDNEGMGYLDTVPVPRTFLQSGDRIGWDLRDKFLFNELAKKVYGKPVNKGALDEIWVGSTTPAGNDFRLFDEGMSYMRIGDRGDRSQRITRGVMLHRAITARALTNTMIGAAMAKDFGPRWPVYSKIFDNKGPIPHHSHQPHKHAQLVKQDGKPESYYFPPQANNDGLRDFAWTAIGLRPSATKEQVMEIMGAWYEGRILSRELGGSLMPLLPGLCANVGTGILHAPGSLATWEPQWASDVFGLYDTLVQDRDVPWDLLIKDMPMSTVDGKELRPDRQEDLKLIVDQLNWEANIDPNIIANHFYKPIVDRKKEGKYYDKWVAVGVYSGEEKFTSKELTVMPGHVAEIKDPGASVWLMMQGAGMLGKLPVSTPRIMRVRGQYNNIVWVSDERAKSGVIRVDNTRGGEPLVALRYLGPNVHGMANLPKLSQGMYEMNQM